MSRYRSDEQADLINRLGSMNQRIKNLEAVPNPSSTDLKEDDVITWGDDVTLYRRLPDVLKTDDTFEVGKDLVVDQNASITGNITVNGIGAVRYAYKTNETVNNSITYKTDSDLHLDVPVLGTYLLEGALWYDASTTGDFKMRFGYSATPHPLRWTGNGPNITTSTNPTFSLIFGNAELQLSGAGTPTGTFRCIQVSGVLRDANPGTLSVQYGQVVADATANTKFIFGSWLRIERMG